MRPANRSPLPDLDRMLREANALLTQAGLPLCHSLRPVDDSDTANPTVVALAGGDRYVIKVCTRYPETVVAQARLANRIGEVTRLPIPRHYALAPAEDRLPLLVMQWMPGEQLRLLLPRLDESQSSQLAQDWGRCVGTFHQATIDVTAVEGEHARFVAGLLDRVGRDLGKLSDGQAIAPSEAQAVREWMEARSEAVRNPALLGLTKSDVDVRDFLGLLQPCPHISAMLDWEAVGYGECLWNLATVCVRLHLMNLPRLWPAFLAGYSAAGAFRWRPSAAAEYYLAARTVIAAGAGQPAAGGLLRTLLAGENWAFPAP